MEPITPQTPPEQHQHFLNKKFAITFVILLLVGGGAYAGIWYWGNRQIDQQDIPKFTPMVTNSTSPTTGWRTYTNTQYGFEFKYPADWVATEINANRYINIEVIPKGGERTNGLNVVVMTSRQFADYYSEANITARLTDPIAGQMTYELNEETGAGGFIRIGYFEFQDNYFIFSRVPGNNTVEAILPTFKFADDFIGKFCGGIEPIKCPSGYTCQLEGASVDAIGKCVKNVR